MTPKEFRRIRQQLGLEQIELAKKLKKSESAINRWERGKHKIPYSAQLYMMGLLYNRVQLVEPEVLEDG